MTIDEGKILQLSCHVRGSQPIKVQWLKAGKELRSSDKCSFSFVNGNALLELQAVTKTDSGEYVCKASNVAGTDICKSKVTIKGTVKQMYFHGNSNAMLVTTSSSW